MFISKLDSFIMPPVISSTPFNKALNIYGKSNIFTSNETNILNVITIPSIIRSDDIALLIDDIRTFIKLSLY